MKSLNFVMLLGFIGSDPEIRTTNGGNKVAKFSIATNEKFNDNSGKPQERTQWHRITAFGNLAEIVEQIAYKGDACSIVGKIEYSESGDGDNKKYWTDIIAREISVIPRGEKPQAEPAPEPAPPPPAPKSRSRSRS